MFSMPYELNLETGPGQGGRLEAGWRHGGRLEAGGRQAGGRLETGWGQAGGRLEAGWRQAGDRPSPAQPSPGAAEIHVKFECWEAEPARLS